MKVVDVRAALESADCTIERTSRGHFKVRRDGCPGPQTIAVGRDGLVKKCYLSRIKNQLGLCD